MKGIKFISSLIIFFYSLLIFADNNASIRGEITEAFSGYPIVGATIIVHNTNPLIASLSDADGKFSLPNISPGRYTVTASFVGYNAAVAHNIMVINGKESVLQFSLEEKITNLNDVVVTANNNKFNPLNELAFTSARSFTVEETERYAGSWGDPSRMVANFAGVMSSNDARNDIIIRGNSPSGLLWNIDGVNVVNPNHFGSQGTTGGPISMLNSNLLSNSDFITGAFPSEYGNALSGVFDLNLRTGNREKYEFMAQMGLNGFEGLIEGPIKRGNTNQNGSFIVDYRYSTLKILRDIGFDFGTGDAIPKYQDLALLVDLPTKHTGRFRFTAITGKSNIAIGRNFDEEEALGKGPMNSASDFAGNVLIGILSNTLMYNENTRIKSTISYQETSNTIVNDTIDYINETYFNYYAANQTEKKLSASVQLKHRFNFQNNITFGLIANRLITSYSDSVWVKELEMRKYLRNITDKHSNLLQGYVTWQHKFSDNLVINTGAHSQYYDLNNQISVEPRIGMQWKCAPNHQFSVGYGLHSQLQPRIIYFTKEYDILSNTYSEKNHHLQFSKANHYVVGYDIRIGSNFRIKTEGYYQDLYHVPISSQDAQYSMLNTGSSYYYEPVYDLENTGKGINYGIELTVEKFLHNGYYFLLTGSLFDSKYQGYDQVWRNTAFNTNYASNLLAGYELRVGKNHFLTVDIRTVWSGGLRYTPINLEASKNAGEEVSEVNRAYENQFSDYIRCDFRTGFKYNSKRITQEIGVDLNNITNHKNIFSQEYNKATQQISTVYQQGFMLVLFYRINF
jgi:hypothetical protein